MSYKNIPLRQLGEVAQGISLSRYQEAQGLSERIVNVGDLDQIYIKDLEDLSEVRLAESNSHLYDRYRLKKNDVVIGRKGKPLKASVVTKEAQGSLAGQNVAFLQLKSELVDPVYLVALMRSRWIESSLEFLYGSSSTIASIRTSQLRDFKIPLPDLQIQKEIAQLFVATRRAEEAAIETVQIYKQLTDLAILKILDEENE